jgi:hypothetical protein
MAGPKPALEVQEKWWRSQAETALAVDSADAPLEEAELHLEPTPRRPAAAVPKP